MTMKLFQPSFDSKLQDAILELEHLRRIRLEGTTPAFVFFQLKRLFHILESLGSARIEGNRTTVAQYLEATEKNNQLGKTEQFQEVTNIDGALKYIDESVTPDFYISHKFIRELQQLVVRGLTKEGDDHAGSYRDCQVIITGASHTPPEPILVQELMDDFVTFINKKDPPKYDLIKVALAHHRFGWIHPFRNGNGRTVRLLTYAMLIKYGFNVDTAGRILNPTAIFCCDRNKYYEMLSKADNGTTEGVEAWCLYLLTGILQERKKLDILTDYEQVKAKILLPAVKNALQKGLISLDEEKTLEVSIRNKTVTAADVASALNIKSSAATYLLGKLREKDLIESVEQSKRRYCLKFSSSKLIYGIVDALNKHELIPSNLLKDK